MTDFDIKEIKQSAKQVLIELDLPEQAKTKCLAILDDHRTREILTVRNADGIVAGAIYIAGILTENRFTQQSLADVMDISQATIRKYYAMLAKSLELKKKKH
jgi:transcription initiation factor TFIIB